MSTQGIKVLNDNGQIIISDATSTFYYYGPAEMAQIVGSGVESGVTIRTYNSYTSKPIIPFVRPHSTALVAITRIYRSVNNYWFMEVAQAGTDTAAPEIFIFTTADAENWNSRFSRGDRSKGIKVIREDGSTSFDSSVGQPLSVRAAFNVIPPYEPTAGGQNLRAVNTYTYNIDPAISQPMFGYYSMALAEREFTAYQYSRSCTGVDIWGACFGFTDTLSRADRYWSFFHAAMGLSGSTLHCGWVEYSNGHVWSSASSSGFSVFIPIIDLGGGSAQGGTPPFVTATINWTTSKVLVADKAFYPNTNYTYTPPIPNAPRNLVVQMRPEGAMGGRLVADWQNSATYPFATYYNIYKRKTGYGSFELVGATYNTSASGPTPYFDFPPGAALLKMNQTLNTGVPFYSQDRTCFLLAQTDANLVLYGADGAGNANSVIANFGVNTLPGGGYPSRLVMQSDGNVVMYRNSDNYPVFNIGSFTGYTDYALYVGNDHTVSVWGYYAEGGAWVNYYSLLGDYYRQLPVATWEVGVQSVNSANVGGGYITAASTTEPLPSGGD